MAQQDALSQPLKQIFSGLKAEAGSETHIVDILDLFGKIVGCLQDTATRLDSATAQELAKIKARIGDSVDKVTHLSSWDRSRLHEAGCELDAVVTATETATNTIMENAEVILEADATTPETYAETVNAAVMQIFEACSFQDITGQRIAKVVGILGDIENRLSEILDAIGIIQPSEETPLSDAEKRKQDLLLYGPAKEGEGATQDEIDALFD